MERSPLTIVIWLVAAGLAVLVAMRLLGGGEEVGGGQPVRLDAGGTASAVDRVGAAGQAGGATPSGPAGKAGGAAPPGATDGVIVHVAGAVRRAGLYRVAPDARVAAALERAGGPSRRADLTAVNLAARVQDGQQIVVPAASRGGPAPAAGSGGGPKPSLGSATPEQLEELDGIGPTLAERIVEYRTENGGFRSVEDLAEVEGIGEKRLESLREALGP